MAENKKPVGGKVKPTAGSKPKPKKKKKPFGFLADEKPPRGRPAKYDRQALIMTKKYMLLGVTHEQLADLLGVSINTIDNWRKNYPEFAEIIERHKIKANAAVAKGLHRRAVGAKIKAVKIIYDSKIREAAMAAANAIEDPAERLRALLELDRDQVGVIKVPYTEEYVPDTAAALNWLRIRQPDQWSDASGAIPPEPTTDMSPLKDLTYEQLLALKQARTDDKTDK